MTVQVALPYPPSANRLWRAVGGRNIKSAEYRSWLEGAAKCCLGRGKVRGPYRLSIFATRPDNRRRDIDNLIKPLSDALKAGGVIADDSDALSVYAAWLITAPVKGGSIVATVEPV